MAGVALLLALVSAVPVAHGLEVGLTPHGELVATDPCSMRILSECYWSESGASTVLCFAG